MNETTTTIEPSWGHNVQQMFPNGFTPTDQYGDQNWEQIIDLNPEYITVTLKEILRTTVGAAERLIYYRDGHFERYKIYSIEPMQPPVDNTYTLHSFGYAAYNWWKEHKC